MDTKDMVTIAERAGRLVEGLIHDNRVQIKETWCASEAEEQSVSLSFTVKMTGATNSPKVDVKLSFSQKFTDEATEFIDADQAKLPFPEEKK